MKLLFVTQHLDEDSDVLGITVAWLRALAERLAAVHVLALSVGRATLPANVTVHTMGKERGAGKPAQFARFQRTLAELAMRHEVDAIYVHMVPQYAIMAAPLARVFRVPIVLWYTHGSVSGRLRLAHRLVQRVVTASPESFRLPSRKVTVTGHGVNTDLFDQPAAPTADGRAFRLVAVGRISRIKDHETLVRAVDVLCRRDPQTTWEAQIVGAPLYADDTAYLAELQRLARDLTVEGQINFAGSIPNRALPPAYGAADVAVSTSRTGSLDKVVLEGMSCQRPVVTCNEAFEPILGTIDPPLLFPAGDAEALAERILGLRQASTEARSALGQRLRGIVMRDHSVDQWADRTVAVCATLAGSAAGASGRLAAQFDGNTPVSSAQPSRPR